MILAEPGAAAAGDDALPTEHKIWQHPTRVPSHSVRQFIKFCIVGASSTAIYFTIFITLIYGFGLKEWPHDLGIMLAATAGFVVSLGNAFYWNRRWTFKHSRGRPAHHQAVQFALVNIVGLLLNLAIVKGVLILLKGTGLGSMLVRLAGPNAGAHLPDRFPLIAAGVATVVVAFWNFLANKYWTFKH